MLTCWYDMLKEAMGANGENFADRACTLDEEGLRREFYCYSGIPEGAAFTAWGERWVYFPLVYDGSEWIGCAPRHPCDIALEHQGGSPGMVSQDPT